MITNNKLYEMITEQVSQGNEALREQLKAQISEKAENTRTAAQEIAERQSRELNELSAMLNNRLDSIKIELTEQIKAETDNIGSDIDGKADKMENLIRELYLRVEAVRAELSVKIDENLNMVLGSLKTLSDGMTDIQKDTAVIMETLQLILTNMMLDTVDIKEKADYVDF